MMIELLKFSTGFLLISALPSVYALPALEPEADIPTPTRNLVVRANTNEPSLETNTFTTSAAAAYTNCCQFKTGSSGSLLYTLNLAGWGNENNEVHDTISHDTNCAPGLSAAIRKGTKQQITDLICVPSYGALGDTFVSFTLQNPADQSVVSALRSIDASASGSAEWQCSDSSGTTSGSPLCKAQQLAHTVTAQDQCTTHYKVVLDTFDIYGVGWDEAKLGVDGAGLKAQIAKCSVITDWRFGTRNLDAPWSFHASGKTVIGTQACVGRAMKKAGAPASTCAGTS